ncbi:MAG: FAD-binding oxidoreductase [Candidatus Alcyoniella australis]|nr:FAD-binding oxidoreductase [Candidatus Alcyoniella australis]
MANETIGWVEDLASYARVVYDWKALRRPGKGVDYLSAQYRDQVRRIVEALHPKRMKLRVAEVVEQTPSSKTLRMERVDGSFPPFRAGQYVNLYVTIDGVLTSRPYSISSLPGEQALDLTVRDRQGGFVAPHLISQIEAGAELESSGPAGSFYYEPLIDGKDLVFIAGGSGVTPIYSMLRSLLGSDNGFKLNLIYGSRTPNDVIFGKELKKLAQEHKNLKYKLVISDPPKGFRGAKGLLDAALLKKAVGKVAGKTFYVCGPNAMYDLVLPALAELGVPQHKIKRELYGPPDDVTKQPGWPKAIKRNRKFNVTIGGKTFKASAVEPLINSLERNGVVVPALCRSGECSACRTKLISGKVYMPPDIGVRSTDIDFGYIHACVAYPISDIKVKI